VEGKQPATTALTRVTTSRHGLAGGQDSFVKTVHKMSPVRLLNPNCLYDSTCLAVECRCRTHSASLNPSMPTIASSQLPPPHNWDDFEDICADLFSLEWQDRNTVRHGRSGQRQRGVDIHGRPKDGGNAGVQCKGKRQWPPIELTTDEIDEQVAEALKFTPPLTEYVIATTANDDAKLQAHARNVTEDHLTKGLFRVQVLGWGELSRRIKSHDSLIEKHYGFTTLSSVKTELQSLPERIVETIQKKRTGQEAQPQNLQPAVSQALERDFAHRYRIAMQRGFFPEAMKTDQFHGLAQEIIDADPAHLSPALRRTILLRAARSAAVRKDIPLAEQYFNAALESNAPVSQVPAQARIAEARGNIEGAIQILRDSDDAEARSVLLHILFAHRGDDAALGWLAEQNITVRQLNASGLVTLCHIHLQKNDFKTVLTLLGQTTAEQLADSPYIYFLRAATRFAVLMPKPDQEAVLQGMFMDVRRFRPVVPDPILRTELDAAKSDLQSLMPSLRELELREAPRLAEDYLTWFDLLHPAHRDSALAQLRSDMSDPAKALSRLQFAFAYDSKNFDPAPIARYLEKRAEFGGLHEHELRAALVLAMHDSPAAVIRLIAKHRAQLNESFSKLGIALIEIEALALAGDATGARKVLEDNRSQLDEVAVTRLSAAIATAEGADPVTQYKEAYERTKTPDALRVLVGALLDKEDHLALGYYAEKLYAETTDPRDIVLAAKAYAQAGEASNFVRVFEAHPFIKTKDWELTRHYGWQLLNRGHLIEAQKVADDLRTNASSYRDLNLEIAIAIENGEWEKLAQPIAAFLDPAINATGLALIRAAHLSHASGQGPLMDLIAAAVAKGGDDAQVLLGAYMLYIEEGLEDLKTEAHDWFRRALDLSGSDGPIKRFELKDILAQQVEWNEHTKKVNEGITRGDIPFVIAAPGLRTTIVDLILRNFVRNSALGDPRRRAAIPVFSGRRNPMRTGEVKRLALDLTSLLVLGWLGLLAKVIHAYPEIVLPAGTFTELFEGRTRIRQFQKSRLASAQRLQSEIARRRIKVHRSPAQARDSLVEEVGTELAALLRVAEVENGIVLRPAPVHKPGLSDQRDADISAHADRVADMHALLDVLNDARLLNQTAELTAKQYFTLQDKGWLSSARPVFSRPLYIDGLALNYLETVNLLEPVLNNFREIYIESSTEEESSALIEHAKYTSEVLRIIDSIREVIRKAQLSGKITFGPRRSASTDEVNGDEQDDMPATSTLHLLSDLMRSDLVAFDDRALNKEPFGADRTGHRARMVTSLDFIEELYAREMISSDERRTLRYRLRIAGALLVPVDKEEVVAAALRNRQNESVEFRSIREAIGLARIAELPLFPAEVPWFASVTLAIKNAITQIWMDEEDTAKAASLSNALLDLLPKAEDWVERWEGQPPPDWVQAVTISWLVGLSLPVEIPNKKTVTLYNEWLESQVLKPLRARAPSTYQAVVARLRELVNDISEADDE
jgi:hypothetical protein